MIRVAIVEDELGFRRSLRRVIESKSDFNCVAEFGTGAEAIEGIPAVRPDVVLMDLNLPDFSGAEVTARLKTTLPNLSVVILTVYNDSDHIFKALRAGAGGYLLKQATATEIIEAIAEAHRGGAPMTSEIARKVIAAFHEPRPAPAPTETLAPREKEILELVAGGYANKEIADKLSITLSTVCWYSERDLQKAACPKPGAGRQQTPPVVFPSRGRDGGHHVVPAATAPAPMVLWGAVVLRSAYYRQQHL